MTMRDLFSLRGLAVFGAVAFTAYGAVCAFLWAQVFWLLDLPGQVLHGGTVVMTLCVMTMCVLYALGKQRSKLVGALLLVALVTFVAWMVALWFALDRAFYG